jgi:hypothetical protein
VVQDAWVDVKLHAAARVKVGKLKSPFGLERLQSATALGFVERGFPTALAPNRDVGVQVWGDVAGGVVSWAAGVFDGVGRKRFEELCLVRDVSHVTSGINRSLANRRFCLHFRRVNGCWGHESLTLKCGTAMPIVDSARLRPGGAHMGTSHA